MAKTVLAVDNFYESTIKVCRSTLSTDYNLLTTTDAEEALHLLVANSPDLIIADYGPYGSIPDQRIPGDELLLMAAQLVPGIKCALVVSSTMMDTAQTILKNRGVEARHLQKPVKAADLDALVELIGK